MIRVLLIEDDPLIAEIISYYLENAGGYSVTWACTGGEAYALSEQDFDVILLDILLPDINGISACRYLRSRYTCPIIYISCLDDRDTIVRALETGGDDFIVKPFDNKVLEARLQANLRRIAMDKERPSTTIGYGGTELNTTSQSLQHDGNRVELAAIEFRLLSFLMQNSNCFYTAEELYRRIWGKDSYGDIRTVQVHIHAIRTKLEKCGSSHNIKSVRGKGYCFCPAEN